MLKEIEVKIAMETIFEGFCGGVPSDGEGHGISASNFEFFGGFGGQIDFNDSVAVVRDGKFLVSVHKSFVFRFNSLLRFSLSMKDQQATKRPVDQVSSSIHRPFPTREAHLKLIKAIHTKVLTNVHLVPIMLTHSFCEFFSTFSCDL